MVGSSAGTTPPKSGSAVDESLEQKEHKPPSVPNTLHNPQLSRLHQDATPFVMPSKRGINIFAPDFDPQAFFDLLGEDVMFIQHEVLREILELQGDVDYLRRHGLNGRTNVESFRKCVPVVSYGDIEADIMKLVNGESASIFSVDPVSEFHFSSGTTAGKPKYIPTTVRAAEELLGVPPIVLVLYRRLLPVEKGSKTLYLMFAGKQEITPSGLIAGGLSTNYYRSPRFLNRDKSPYDSLCVPDEVILCDDTNQSMYCHLLCALARAPEIVEVSGMFAANIVVGVRALQKHWPEIVEDIRTGTLNNKSVTDPELRTAMEKALQKANPDLANRIERECSQGNWEGIFPRLFPNARYVVGILSGSMLQYVPAVKRFAGHLPTISHFYVTAESGLIGINPNMMCAPKDITYMLWPEKAYYEFIPLDDTNSEVNGEGGTKVVEACDVEVGKEYELVITNTLGFYRYRTGDVVRVTSFRNTLPVVAFVRRNNVVLSVVSDKTDEVELQIVVDKAMALLRETSAMELADYTSTIDVSSLPGRYVIFWEMVDSRNLDHDVLQECANTLDASLMNAPYRRWRCNGHIAPLELRVVREGTFDKMKNDAVMRGAAPSQYKIPRCVNHPQGLEVLKEGTVGSFHSTKTPAI